MSLTLQQHFSNMSFYHILPSNTSPQYFPNNNASRFSTPVEASYHQPGKWEVALMNMKHSLCINTFDNDIITVKNMTSTDESCDELRKAKKPVKIRLSVPKKSSDSRITES